MPFGELRAAVLAGVVGFAVACGGNALGPENQLEVGNLPDNFQLQATALVDVTESLSYGWDMTGTRANVNQSGTVTGGSATLIIEDDAGTEVYRASLAETGSFETAVGVAGSWTVRVELSGMSGVLNFRVQKP